jgi:hypothetical protein
MASPSGYVVTRTLPFVYSDVICTNLHSDLEPGMHAALLALMVRKWLAAACPEPLFAAGPSNIVQIHLSNINRRF